MRRINGNTAKALIIAMSTGIQGIVENSFGTTAIVDSLNRMGGRLELSSVATAALSERLTPTLFGFGEKSLADKLEGVWQSTSGPKEKLTFEKSAGISIVIYGDSSFPSDITTTGSYKVTGNNTFTILEGGEYSDGILDDGTLTITKRGGLTSTFTKQ